MSAVFRAAQLCQQVQAYMVNTDAVEKADRSPVTVADFGSQALICQAISEAFPDDVIVAEEDSQALQENPQLMQRVTGVCRSFCRRDIFSLKQSAIGLIEAVEKWENVSGRWTRLMARKGFCGGDQYAIAH